MEFICENLCSGFDMVLDLPLECSTLPVIYHHCTYFSASLQNAECDGLSAAILQFHFLPLANVHIPGLSSDERFIDFHASTELRIVLIL